MQRIQTDNGRKFTAQVIMLTPLEWGMKWRPIRRGTPHLNGKVERAQQTTLQEFYSVNDLGRPDLSDELGYYQHYYNWMWQRGSLGKTPLERCMEQSPVPLLSADVSDHFDSVRERNYHRYRELRLVQSR